MKKSKLSGTCNREPLGPEGESVASEGAPIDLHQELAELLNYIGAVATSIRCVGQHSKQESHAFSDIVWLGDSLHKLHHLGEAIRLQDRDAIASACCWLIADHESYRNDADSQAAFSRNRVSLDEAIRLFEAISAKVA